MCVQCIWYNCEFVIRINKAEKYETYMSMYYNPYTYVFTHMLRHKQYVYIHSYKCDK